MQEAWTWASGFVMGIAFAVFIDWAVSWCSRIAAKKKGTHIATTVSTCAPTHTGKDYTIAHNEKRIYVTFEAPNGYRYVDTTDNALAVLLSGVMLEEGAA